MSESEISRQRATLAHRNGLHLSPIQQVVRTASQYSAQVRIHFDSKVADAKSAVELMLLGATHGALLEIEGLGSDAADAIQAVASILESSNDG